MAQSKLKLEDRRQISKWINCGKLQFKMLYKASADGGCNASTFHKKCDGQGATVTVAYNSTGYVFGAYASQSFSSNNDWVSDEKMFLFRLREAGKLAYCKYPAEKKSAIYNHSTNGPCFGYKDYINKSVKTLVGRQSVNVIQTTSESKEELRFFADDNPIQSNGTIACENLHTEFTGHGFKTDGLSWEALGGSNKILVDFEVYKVEAMSADPWRINNIEWNQEQRNLLKETIISYKPVASVNVPIINILLIGQVGAGKSSFFNTVKSVFHGYVTTQAVAGSSNHSLTTKYRMYRPRLERGGRQLNFRLCDTMGIEEDSGLDVSNFSLILTGNVRDGFQFHPDQPIGNDDPNLKKDVKLKDKIHVAAFVVDITTIQVMPMKVLDKLKQIKKYVDKSGILSAVILTKIDKMLNVLGEDISTVYYDAEIGEHVDDIAERMGIPRSQVLLVKNYENQNDVDHSTDIITLLAMQQLFRLADSFFDDQLDLLDSSESQTHEEEFARNV